MKKTNISLVTLAILIIVLNHFVSPIFFDEQADSVGTGISLIFLATALLNHLREK